MLEVNMSFKVDNEYVKHILSAVNAEYDEKNDRVTGRFRGKRFEIKGNNAGERIGAYLSEYCEFHGTGIENAVEDLEINDDAQVGFMEMILEV